MERRLVRISLAVVLLLLLVYLATALVLAWSAAQSERHPVVGHPSDLGLEFEDVAFAPRDWDLELRGWYLERGQPHGHVILVHGLDSQRTSDGALDLAARLVEEGYSVLLFDLRGHGESEGARVTAGERERDDVLGAYDFLLTRGAEPGDVALIGRSMGGGIVVMTAALEPGIAAVVADSPFADIGDLIVQEAARRTRFPRWAVQLLRPPAQLFADLLYGIDLRNLRPEEDVRELAYPVLVVHGDADARIDVSHGRRLAENGPEGSELWSPPGVGHVRAFQDLPDEYVSRVVAYLEERLSP